MLKCAAAIMSLIQSARNNGHDPYAYLKDVLTRLSDSSINVSDARVFTAWGKPARIDLKIELSSAAQLQATMAQIRSMADVLDLARCGNS